MQLSKDILRGIRLAAIVFSVLLAGLLSYRMLRVVPQRQAAQEVAPPPPVEPVANTAAPAAPAVAAPAQADVPPPPPTSGARPARKPKQTQPAQSVPSVAVLKDVEAVITTPAPEPVHETAPPQVAAAPAPAPAPAPVTASAPPPSSDDSAKPAPKGNRILRGFGRLLHVGGSKKDSDTQAAVR